MNNHWAGRRVLVTGATGLVGSLTVNELLERGADVTALVLDANPQSEFYRGGAAARAEIVYGALEDFAAVSRAINGGEIQTVIHLGAQTIVSAARRDPMQTFETNIRGTYHVLEACRRVGGMVSAVLVASSDKAYGASASLPYTEDSGLKGLQPYEVSKSCADLLARSFHGSYGLPVGILRCGNIYGGGDLNWSRLIPGTIRLLLDGKSPVIRSDGKFLRDYLYVADAVDGYLKLAEHLTAGRHLGEAFNLSPQSPSAVLEVTAMLRRLLGREDLAPTILNNAEGEIRDQYLDAGKARRLLNWRASHTLEEGLAKTIDWYRRYYGGARS